MKILGISGSPRKNGATSDLVKLVLDATGVETEFISLAGKTVSPCKYCLACAKDNVCKVNDDMPHLREQLIRADAFVFGGCNMWSTLNGQMHCFLERFFQFHHQGNSPLAGKPVVVVGAGGADGQSPAVALERMVANFGLKHVGSVSAQGAFACYTCGIGNTCRISNVKSAIGPDGEIDIQCKPQVQYQTEVVAKAASLGAALKSVLE